MREFILRGEAEYIRDYDEFLKFVKGFGYIEGV